MPGTSNSLPVVVGDKLFVCSEPTTLLCVNLADGKILWQKTNNYEDVLTADQLAQMAADKTAADPLRDQLKTANEDLATAKDAAGKSPNDATLKAAQTAAQQKVDDLTKQLQPLLRWTLPPTHPWNGYSSATPVCDGQNVWVTFGNGVAACYDLAGTRKWARFVEEPKTPGNWGVSSSPVLAGDRLLVNFANCVALNPATGETVWSTGTGFYWGTPTVIKIADVPVAFTPSGQIVRLSDGKVLQQGLYGASFNSPILAGDTVYYFQIPGNFLVGQAFKVPTAAADAVKAEPLWKPRDERYYGSPVYEDGLLYCANNLDTLRCADAVTGQIVYDKKLGLGGQVFSSVCFAGGNLYVTSDAGNTVVVKPGREYTEIARNSLGDTVRSTPVFAGSRVYVRGYKNLYGLGQ
jgi:outer membrane protein assembly factor BamB